MGHLLNIKHNEYIIGRRTRSCHACDGPLPQVSVLGHPSLTMGHPSLAVGCPSLIMGCPSQAVGRLSLCPSQVMPCYSRPEHCPSRDLTISLQMFIGLNPLHNTLV